MKKIHDFHKILGLLLIVAGIIFYFTPVPGTTMMIIVGFIWVLGKTKARHLLKKILGHRMFKFLKIQKLIKKI